MPLCMFNEARHVSLPLPPAHATEAAARVGHRAESSAVLGSAEQRRRGLVLDGCCASRLQGLCPFMRVGRPRGQGEGLSDHRRVLRAVAGGEPAAGAHEASHDAGKDGRSTFGGTLL